MCLSICLWFWLCVWCMYCLSVSSWHLKEIYEGEENKTNKKFTAEMILLHVLISSPVCYHFLLCIVLSWLSLLFSFILSRMLSCNLWQGPPVMHSLHLVQSRSLSVLMVTVSAHLARQHHRFQGIQKWLMCTFSL